MALARRLHRPVVFYGWYIVAVAVLVQCLSAGLSAYAGGVFLKPMASDLGWSRQDFSAVQTVSQVTMGAWAFVIGGLIDRRGPRLLMLSGAVISGGALCATAMVREPWQFYLTRGVAQTIGMAMVGNLVVNVTLARWFVLRRGTAIAMASIGFSLGGVLLSPLMAWWIEMWGWREVWVILACITWAVAIPCAFVMRRSPEDYGLTPDGLTSEEAANRAKTRGRSSAASEISFTRREAVRTPALWLIIVAYGLGNTALGALLLHAVPYLTDHGSSPGRAAFLLSSYSWASLLSKFYWAPLMDRIHARYLSCIAFLVMGMSMVGLLWSGGVGSELLVGLSLFAFGCAGGGAIPLQETVWASYFGRAHLGSVRTVGMPISIIFSAGGPFAAGALYDATGSYTVPFLIFAAFGVAGAVLIFLARPPRPPVRTVTASQQSRELATPVASADAEEVAPASAP